MSISRTDLIKVGKPNHEYATLQAMIWGWMISAQDDVSKNVVAI